MSKDNKDTFDLNLIRKIVEISDIRLFPLYIKEVYKDLVDRSDSNKKQGINKLTFYDYIKLPVFIADKVFSAFDADNDLHLNLKEFSEGMNSLYYGNFKQTLKIIFAIYDFDKDGAINKEDIKILFSYLPLKNEEKQSESLKEIEAILASIKIESSFNFNKFVEVIEKTKSDIYLQLLCYLYEHKPFSVENVESCKLLSKYQELVSSGATQDGVEGSSPPLRHVSSVVLDERIILSSPSKTSIFKPVDNIIKMMEFNEFKLDDDDPTDVEIKLPMQIEKKGFASKITTNDLKNNEMIRFSNQREFKDDKNILNSPTKFLKSANNKMDEFKLEPININSSPQRSPDKKKSTINPQAQDTVKKESLIYKVTESKNLKQYYLALCNKDIYYFKDDRCKELLGMHNLAGCYIMDLDEKPLEVQGKNLYAFTIKFRNKVRSYYHDSLSETKEWISLLKKAIGYMQFDDKYEMQQKTLGEGKFGLVKLGIHKGTGEKVAIKIIKKEAMNNKDYELVKSEIDIMKMCKHPNVVRLLDHFENNDFIYIVMEFLAGGTLANYLEKTPIEDLSEKDCSILTYQVSKALEYLHQFGIIHRDLKPENIMIKGKLPYDSLEALKVMDFGLGKILGPHEKVADGFGTLTYVSPEVLTRKPYNKSVDIWALGVIVYYSLSGSFPFDDASNDEETIAKKIVFDELKFPHKSWLTRSPAVKDFIMKTLAKNMDKRMKIGEVVNHQWFQENVMTSKIYKK